MKKIILDGKMLKTPAAAHPYLQKMLEFDDYYGQNLDALYECLTDLSNVEIEITPTDDCTEFFERVLHVFKAAESDTAIAVHYTDPLQDR